MTRAWLGWGAAGLGAVAVVATALSFVRAKQWWIRVWDFPRVQLFVAAALALAAFSWGDRHAGVVHVGGQALLGAVLLIQGAAIWRYTRLAPREVERSDRADPARRIALLESNVLQTNRDADRLAAVARGADADVMVFVETDAWWQERLDAAFAASHPHGLRCALPNTYGMLLYSRLPLEDARIDFLLQDDIPSMQARVVLRSGDRVWLNCVHPRPPAPGESDESLARDAELLVVGKRVCDAPLPAIVLGDLNDVAWSHTTRLFQKTSQLLDPRKGRGFYSTFHARYPGLRWPLDHVFFSKQFRLVSMERLDYVGSDHFPVCVVLSLEPDAAARQEAPAADAADHQEAQETLAEASTEVPAEGGKG
ncbi:endonuclease/exonuclease/phosphatase family protein [Roseisolibacter sp. H3M3-2]|uniref:endonuclease/exonuclease/phosphatase family protein n=1 Tax=Roseisolibacter sp. H3M3-2 TaxID=3031323 RepID=UPI0023DA758E|nr:endonuclease/exonuclease/phosphatase family protein [Roseisolibacter sp. H3M3-2]MDF1502993.1 endonuclease/exonuclease/phosphatase family protein [Roseisolibacter sp. H3M3-2]